MVDKLKGSMQRESGYSDDLSVSGARLDTEVSNDDGSMNICAGMVRVDLGCEKHVSIFLNMFNFAFLFFGCVELFREVIVCLLIGRMISCRFYENDRVTQKPHKVAIGLTLCKK